MPMTTPIVPDSACADCGAADAKFLFRRGEAICEACAPQYFPEDLVEKTTFPG
jgi:hypothetical protein